MIHFKKKVLFLIVIASLFVGIVGVINVDTTYAASKLSVTGPKAVPPEGL